MPQVTVFAPLRLLWAGTWQTKGLHFFFVPKNQIKSIQMPILGIIHKCCISKKRRYYWNNYTRLSSCTVYSICASNASTCTIASISLHDGVFAREIVKFEGVTYLWTLLDYTDILAHAIRFVCNLISLQISIRKIWIATRKVTFNGKIISYSIMLLACTQLT